MIKYTQTKVIFIRYYNRINCDAVAIASAALLMMTMMMFVFAILTFDFF